MKNNLFAALIVGLFLILVMGLLVACDMNGMETPADYAIATDGEYLPIYKVNCTAQRIADTVEVEWNGNAYSAYLTPESEIQTGDQVVAVFTIFEGEVQLINIE